MLVCFCTVPKFTRHQSRPREVERGKRGRERQREQGRESHRREREGARERDKVEREGTTGGERQRGGNTRFRSGLYRQVRRKALVGSEEGMY